MTREPLHYWRRRRGMSLGAYVHNARLKRAWPLRLDEPMFADSKLFEALKKPVGHRSGMSMNAHTWAEWLSNYAENARCGELARDEAARQPMTIQIGPRWMIPVFPPGDLS